MNPGAPLDTLTTRQLLTRAATLLEEAGDCELYDFRRGPLYSAAGRKHTLHRAISGE